MTTILPHPVAAVAESVSISLPPETLVQVAAAVAELLAANDRFGLTSPWMTRREAAEHLRLPVSRLEKDRDIPCHRDGRRVLYHRREVDEYLLERG